jgi:hypothetical protein
MGGGSIDWADRADRGFRARTLIIGNPGVDYSIPYDFSAEETDLQRYRPSLASFASWLLRKCGALHPSLPPSPPSIHLADVKPGTAAQGRPIIVRFISRGSRPHLII